MPHVDEGLLHAYLDGALDAVDAAPGRGHGTTRTEVDAHLAHCADCRALLERERAVREGAASILGGLPPVDVPAFDSLPSVGAATRARRGRALPYAWAATVVLALGVGWWGSQLRQRGAVVLDEPTMSRAPAAEPPAQPAVNDATLADGARVESAPRAAASGRAQESRTEAAHRASGEAQREERTRDVASPPAGRAAAAAPGRDSTALALQELVVTGSTRRTAVAPDTPTIRSTDSVRATQQSAATRPMVAAAPPPPSQSFVPSLRADALRVPSIELKAAEPDAAAVFRFRAALNAARAGRLVWSERDPAAAPLHIEGAGAPRVTVAHYGVAELTRVTQELGGGEIEILVWREALGRTAEAAAAANLAAADPPRFTILTDQAAPAEGGRTPGEITILLDARGELVSLRAPLPSSEIAALLARLRH